MRPSSLLAGLAALAALALTASPAAAGGLRLSPALDADRHVLWTEELGGLELSVELPDFDPADPSASGFGSFDLSRLREIDESLRELDPLPVRWIRLPIASEGELALEVHELRFTDGSVASISEGSTGVGKHRAPLLDGELAPEQPLALDGVGWDGDQRFAYFRLMPLLRSLDGGEDRVLRSARARLHYGDGVGPLPSDPGLGRGFSAGNRDTLDDGAPAAPSLGVRARVLVTEAGLQVIPRAALESVAPELLAAEPSRLRLLRDGREVARALVRDGSGELEAIEFVGSPRLGEQELGVFQAGDFTDTEVFFLELAPAGESGRDIELRRVAPAGTRAPLADLAAVARLEENSFFYNTVATADFDHWAWGPQLRSDGSAPAELAVSLDLPGLDAAGDGPVDFRVTWHGRGADEVERPHRTELHLGGELLDSADWEGFRVLVQRGRSSAAAVAAAGELVVSVPGLPGTGTDGAALDHVLVGYRRLPTADDDLLDARIPDGPRRLRVTGFSDASAARAFDLASADAPVELTGGLAAGDSLTLDLDGGSLGRVVRLVGPGAVRSPEVQRSEPENLLAPATGADWLAVLPGELESSAQLPLLLAARTAGGWSPRVAKLQDVFDLFSFGRPDPRAVPRLLAHARENWPEPKTEVLLLLGDGSQDYKGVVDPGASLLPAQLFSDPAEQVVIGHHAGDARAATVAGEDFLPEAAVGRIPARGPGELDAAIVKILASETPAPGDWRRRLFFAVDDARASDGFEPLVDALAAATPAPHAVGRIGGAAMLLNQTDDELAVDGGAAVVIYAGNGAIDRWSPPGAFGAPYLALSDVPTLQPGGPWPVFVDGGSLLTGAYHHESDVPALQEALLLAPGAGSAGGIAPSGDLTAEHGNTLLVAAHEALFGLDRVRTLGELAERVRRTLDEVGGPRAPQAVAGLVTFGDPAMPLALPVPPQPPWLTARGTDTLIELDWAAPADAPANARYRLYRSEHAAGPYALHADAIEGLAFADEAVEAEQTYHYRLTLLDEEGFESPASNRAQGRVGEEPEVRVFGCLPDSGPLAGGQFVRIVGRGFQPGAIGFIGDEPCASSRWIDDGALECVTPMSARPGLRNARVVNPDTTNGERARAYIYCPSQGRGLRPVIGAPSLALATSGQLESFAAEGDTVVVVDEDGGYRRYEPPTRRPDQPRPDSFEPVIDPDLSRIIRFPVPNCGN